MATIDEQMCRSLGGQSDFQWVCFDVVGAAGGLLCIWNKDSFKMVFFFSGVGFYGVLGEWGRNNIRCFIVNVCSPCSLMGKRKLWNDLQNDEGGFCKGIWCFVGDFNAVKNSNERKGSFVQGSTSKIAEFREFVEDMNLIDLPILGRLFTWYK